MSDTLIPCEACHRHVRASETSCPFCEHTRESTSASPARLPNQRLGRAAAFAFAASLSVSACSSDDDVTTSGGATDGSTQGDTSAPPESDGPSNDQGSVVALYGAPVFDGGSPADASKQDASKPDASTDAAPEDASKADAESDGGPRDSGGAMALYGLPAPDRG